MPSRTLAFMKAYFQNKFDIPSQFSCLCSFLKAMMAESAECEPVPMDSEDELFIMYTSGTTGSPTGVVHTQAGYLLYAALTHKV